MMKNNNQSNKLSRKEINYILGLYEELKTEMLYHFFAYELKPFIEDEGPIYTCLSDDPKTIKLVFKYLECLGWGYSSYGECKEWEVDNCSTYQSYSSYKITNKDNFVNIESSHDFVCDSIINYEINVIYINNSELLKKLNFVIRHKDVVKGKLKSDAESYKALNEKIYIKQKAPKIKSKKSPRFPVDSILKSLFK